MSDASAKLVYFHHRFSIIVPFLCIMYAKTQFLQMRVVAYKCPRYLIGYKTWAKSYDQLIECRIVYCEPSEFLEVQIVFCYFILVRIITRVRALLRPISMMFCH